MKHGRSEDTTSACQECGASVYREHLDSGIARYEDGRLLCAHCVAEFEAKHDTNDADGGFEPIVFEDEVGGDAGASDALSHSRIHGATKAGLSTPGAWDDSKFQRPLSPKSAGASRCRVFHCKLSEGALEFMINQINDWLDANDQIVVKFMNSAIGPFEGKHTEQNLMITVFY